MQYTDTIQRGPNVPANPIPFAGFGPPPSAPATGSGSPGSDPFATSGPASPVPRARAGPTDPARVASPGPALETRRTTRGRASLMFAPTPRVGSPVSLTSDDRNGTDGEDNEEI